MPRRITAFGAVLPALAITLSLAVGGPARAQTTPQPNVILVLADDLAAAETRHLPRTTRHLLTKGVNFTNAYVNSSLCCPSRVTLLTGRYAHNTGIHSNDPPAGGYDGVYNAGLEATMLPTWLKSAGYNTAYLGKYVNGYGSSRVVANTRIPPGWDQWYALASSVRYYNYTLNENGQLVAYGSNASAYATDVMAARTATVLDGLLAANQPFFLMLAPIAPHQTTGASEDGGGQMTEPAPRHRTLLEGLTAPRQPSFGEEVIGDKPSHIRSLPALTDADVDWIDRNYRSRAQSLMALDEMLGAVLAKLAAHPAGANTYIVFTSDNGFFFGEHRIQNGKGRLYEPAHRVPLMISGPGVRPGVQRTDLVVNADLAPTIAQWAGATPPANVDGRSIDALLRTDRRLTWPRKSLPLTWLQRASGLRLPSYTYFETKTGTSTPFVELYDLLVDPDQTTNIASRLTSASAAALRTALAQQTSCRGAACQTVEDELSDSLVRFNP